MDKVRDMFHHTVPCWLFFLKQHAAKFVIPDTCHVQRNMTALLCISVWSTVNCLYLDHVFSLLVPDKYMRKHRHLIEDSVSVDYRKVSLTHTRASTVFTAGLFLSDTRCTLLLSWQFTVDHVCRVLIKTCRSDCESQQGGLMNVAHLAKDD